MQTEKTTTTCGQSRKCPQEPDLIRLFNLQKRRINDGKDIICGGADL